MSEPIDIAALRAQANALTKIEPNCDCQVGGVDAASIDADWLAYVGRNFCRVLDVVERLLAETEPPMSSEPIDLAAIRARCKAATPGPWTFNDTTDYRGRKGEFRAPGPFNGFMLVGPWTGDADPEFMAAARQDVSALRGEVVRLRAENDDLDVCHNLRCNVIHYVGRYCPACEHDEAGQRLPSHERAAQVHTDPPQAGRAAE